MIATRLAAAARLVLWVLVLAYGMLVARDFFHFADRLVYVALDDGLANQAYVIANEGRYGFLASPTLFGVPRHFGEVSYGPWYFYAAGALIWLFGYTLTLVRSVHLWVVAGSVLAAAWWFPRRYRVIGAAVFGLGAFYCFETGMWPMARPDSAVTAFAAAFVVLAGLGISKGHARYWFGAGLAASCGAFAHLIAWSLVPTCLLLFAYAAWEHRSDDALPDRPKRRLVASFAALSIGGVLGALMFYGSFGFRIGDQLKMFAAYGELVQKSDSFWFILAKHFTTAFDYLFHWQRWLVGGVLAAGWATVAWLFTMTPRGRRRLNAWLLPPLMVWSAYLLSSGAYTNHHKAYAILQQVMAFWTAGALAVTSLMVCRRYSRAAAQWLACAAMLILALQSTRLIGWQLEQYPLKQDRASRWISISEHTDRLLGPVPAGATAWGAVMYGIETPRRIQLIQVTEGLVLLPRVRDDQKPALLPEFLIWGYPEVRDNAIGVLRGENSLLNQVADVLPGATYRLASLVAAAPYGVSRVYARTTALPPHDTLPQVHVYDAAHRYWRTQISQPLPAVFAPTPPVRIRLGYTGDTPAAAATSTMSAELPAGTYLLKVGIRPGAGNSRRRLLAATSRAELDQTIGELGPRGDFAGYFLDQTTVWLLGEHDGGPLFVSQFDDGQGAAIESVRVFPVDGAADTEYSSPSAPAHDFGRDWTLVAGVRTEMTTEGLTVAGDASTDGYQIVSGAMAASSGDAISVALDVDIQQGRVCTGVLNGQQQAWILPPDALRSRLSFRMDRGERFFVVVANCNPAPGAPSRFMVRSASYVVHPGSFYTDRLMNEAFGREGQR